MKRIVLIILTLALVIAVASCKQNKKPQQPTDDKPISDKADSDIGIPSNASGGVSEKITSTEKRDSDNAEEPIFRSDDMTP